MLARNHQIQKTMNKSMRSSLRYVVIILTVIAYVPMCYCLAGPSLCTSTMVSKANPTIHCIQSGHLVPFIFSILCVIIWIPLCGILQTYLFLPHVKHNGIFASPTGYFRLFYFLIVTIVMLICLYLPDFHVLQASLAFGLSLAYFAYVILFRPFYHVAGTSGPDDSPYTTMSSLSPENLMGQAGTSNPQTSTFLQKFSSPSKIEPATRFLQSRKLRHRKECVELVEDVYEFYTKRHPDNVNLLINAAIFHMDFTKKYSVSLQLLQQARQNFPFFMDKWRIFLLMGEAEERMKEAGGNFSLMAEREIQYANQIQEAKTEYLRALSYLDVMWGQFKRNNLDFNRIQLYGVRGMESGQKSMNILIKLMRSFKESVEPMKVFCQLQKNVFLDNDIVRIFEEEIKAIAGFNKRKQQKLADKHPKDMEKKSETKKKKKKGKAKDKKKGMLKPSKIEPDTVHVSKSKLLPKTNVSSDFLPPLLSPSADGAPQHAFMAPSASNSKLIPNKMQRQESRSKLTSSKNNLEMLQQDKALPMMTKSASKSLIAGKKFLQSSLQKLPALIGLGKEKTAKSKSKSEDVENPEQEEEEVQRVRERRNVNMLLRNVEVLKNLQSSRSFYIAIVIIVIVLAALLAVPLIFLLLQSHECLHICENVLDLGQISLHLNLLSISTHDVLVYMEADRTGGFSGTGDVDPSWAIQGLDDVWYLAKDSAQTISKLLPSAFDDTPLQFSSWRDPVFDSFFPQLVHGMNEFVLVEQTKGLLDIIGSFTNTGHDLSDNRLLTGSGDDEALFNMLINIPLSASEAVKQVMSEMINGQLKQWLYSMISGGAATGVAVIVAIVAILKLFTSRAGKITNERKDTLVGIAGSYREHKDQCAQIVKDALGVGVDHEEEDDEVASEKEKDSSQPDESQGESSSTDDSEESVVNEIVDDGVLFQPPRHMTMTSLETDVSLTISDSANEIPKLSRNDTILAEVVNEDGDNLFSMNEDKAKPKPKAKPSILPPVMAGPQTGQPTVPNTSISFPMQQPLSSGLGAQPTTSLFGTGTSILNQPLGGLTLNPGPQLFPQFQTQQFQMQPQLQTHPFQFSLMNNFGQQNNFGQLNPNFGLNTNLPQPSLTQPLNQPQLFQNFNFMNYQNMNPEAMQNFLHTALEEDNDDEPGEDDHLRLNEDVDPGFAQLKNKLREEEEEAERLRMEDLNGAKERIGTLTGILPSSFQTCTTLGIIGVVTGILLIVAGLLLCMLNIRTMTSLPYAASVQASVFSQLGMFAQQLVYQLSPTFSDARAVKYATNPTWKTPTHLTTNITQTLSFLERHTTYHNALHSLVSYGSNQYGITSDRRIDQFSVHRSRGFFSGVDKYMLTEKSCFCNNATRCVPGRVGGQMQDWIGFDSVISKLSSNAFQLSKYKSTDTFSPSMIEYEQVYDVLVYDGRDGMHEYLSTLFDSISDYISGMRLAGILLWAVGLGVTLISVLAFLAPLGRTLVTAANTTELLKQLVEDTGDSSKLDLLEKDAINEIEMEEVHDTERNSSADSSANLDEKKRKAVK
ncbi:hypothetical protein BLNAU_805 [Blattamonas nauphoetae]|uniref:Uncharacterized protein n=1 Tax=Blattamonas nauphoetae TaxID=2049346 RepID=A0ABQ9YKI7_9EUKA|nr:hypothetical protein BLNAU_805 [Blattamonas nauphoetae]